MITPKRFLRVCIDERLIVDIATESPDEKVTSEDIGVMIEYLELAKRSFARYEGDLLIERERVERLAADFPQRLTSMHGD